MATTRRVLYRGAFYHVTVRAVDGRKLFLDDPHRLAFLLQLAGVTEEQGWIVLAYCLMTNHFHLLLRTPEEGLPEGMQRLNTWLAIGFNRRLNRRGRVLEAPYRARLVEAEPHLLQAARYVVNNPVRAGMVEHAEDYEWSSCRATARLAVAHRCLTTDRLLARLGGAAGYREFVAAGRHVRSLDEILAAAAPAAA